MLTRILSLAVFLCLATAAAWSQDSRGNIAGKISDPSAAVIAGAKVVVTNIAMGTATELRTNETGFYQANYLLPGMYKVEASAPGFKTVVHDNIELRVSDRLEINLTLDVGDSGQSVTVTADVPLMNTETASVGTVVDSRRIADLPLSYGNPFQLIGSAAGVAFTGDARLDRPFEPTHIVGYAMAGTRGNLSDVTIDGAPTTATANGNQVIAAYVPPTDIVQEFKVQTNTFDAQFGQTMGGVTNISLKAGSNAFHGSAGFTFQRPSFWANDFFNNSAGKPRADFMFNRWGGSFGGPVYIPKVYTGRNKTFFMFGYEGIHDSRPRHDDTTNTVPTTAEKNGDFSALLAIPGTGASYQIYNPFSRRAASTAGRYQEDPFPGNIIPPSLFSTVGKNVLSYFPTPLTAGAPDGTNNMVDSSVTERAKYYNLSWRVDHNITTNERIFARVSLYRRDSTYNNYFSNLATGVTFQFLARSAVFDHVAILSPTLVWNNKYSYSRFIRYQEANRDADGFDLTKLGFPASYANSIPADVRTFPQFNMTGYIPTASAAGENRPVMNHTLSSTLTKVRGSHSVRAGLEFRAYQENDKFFGFQQTGTFNFDSTWTRGPLDNAANSPGSIGQSVAALLLGLPTSTSNVARSASYAEQSNSWGLFVQDDWKVTQRLTVNLGLRYEFEQPLHERYNRSVLGFDAAYVQPFSAAAQAVYANAPLKELPASQFAARGGLNFAGVGGNPSSLYNTPKTEVMPRLGVAYQVDNHTVIRSGFGIFYGFLGARRGDVIQSGFSQNTNVVPTTDNINFTGTLSNPFPNGISEPVGAAAGPQTFLGQTISYFNQNPQPQRVFRWELGVQHQLKGGILLDLNYTGNKTLHIDLNPTGNPNVVNTNPIPDRYLCTSPVRDDTCNNYLTGTVANPFYKLGPAGNTQGTFTNTTIARSTLLMPYPVFGNINTSVNSGYSWYHSATVVVEKRFSKGFTATGNYTFSKFMQADELLNPGDAAPLRVISDQDVPHRFSISSVGELPFGKGKPLLSNTGRLVSRLVGGWQISGIYSYQVGFPLAWGNVLYYGNPANIVKPAGQRSVNGWFNTAGFETASGKQLANNLRTWPLRFPQIRGRNGNNIDFALIKNTRITEGRELQFRAEALNAFNHPGFPSPQMTATSSTFGKITPSNQAGYPRRLQLAVKYIF